MKQEELHAALKSIGLPVAYDEFVSTPEWPAPEPPFITYQFSYSSDMTADNHNYLDIANFQIELYTIDKDLPTEKLVQDKLKELRLPYSKIGASIESEQMKQIIYEIQLIGG